MSRLSALAAISLLLVCAPGAYAQKVNDGTQTGLPDTATFSGSPFDTVSLQNGNLHVRIPLRTVPQRGGKSLEWYFQYDIESWQVWDDRTDSANPVSGVDLINNPPVSVGWRLSNNLQWSLTSQQVPTNCGTYLADMDWALIDPDGAQHPLFLSSGVPGCAPAITKSLTLDGSGSRVDISVSPATAILKDGTQVLPTWKDANGNMQSTNADMLQRNTLVVFDAPRVSYTTPLGSTAYGPQYTTWSYTDTNGTTRSFRLDYQAIDVLTSFCYFAAYSCTEFSGVFLVPSTVTLPNTSIYRFTWANNTAAELRRIDLPTGGYISYTYGQFATPSKSIDTSIKATYVRNSVATRTVFDGTARLWTYNGYGTVTDPLGNKEVHTYGSINGCGVTDCFPNSYEKNVQYYDATGSLLRTVQRDWASESYPPTAALFPPAVPINPRVIRETTTLENNLVRKRETDYETLSATFLDPNATYTTSWLNPTAVREYDYAAGAPGTLLRTTNFTYLHSGNSAYQTRNIANRPLTKTVLNGSGSQVSQTTYEYDVYTHTNQAMQPSSAVQHDSTFSTSFTYRGNVTAVQLWRNTDGALLTTTNQYDDAGNLLSAIDPLLHKTSFDYTDSWTNSACAPAGQGKAYVTSVTNALNQVTSNSYNSCSGLAGSSRDPNLLTTTFSYDLMNRPTVTNFPDGAQTTECFTDVGGSTCTQAPPPYAFVTTKKMTSSTSLKTTAVLDGLGRVSQTQLNSDPQGTVYRDTAYDGLGRVYTVSNPYRTGSDPTTSLGTTTYFYDALGRKCLEVPPDGTQPTGGVCPSTQPANTIFTTYSGNTTTVTDQTGKSRKSVTDGLGRLTQVFEDPGGLNYETDYGYDALGNLLCAAQKGTNSGTFTNCTSIPTGWHPRTFSYDSLSRLLTSSNPETGTITYKYDSDTNCASPNSFIGLLVSKTDARGIRTCAQYDALSRGTVLNYSNGDPTITTTYDQAACLTLPACQNIGQRTSRTDAAGSEAWAYQVDATNLRSVHVNQRTTNSITKTSTYYLDLTGNVTQAIYPTGRVVNYAFDAANRPKSAADGSNGITYATDFQTVPSGCLSGAVCYTPQGTFYALSIGQSAGFTGLNFTHTYNNRLQPNEFKASSTGGNAIDITYNFVDSISGHNAGHVYGIANNLDTSRSQTFTYDQLNRITSALTTSTHATSPAHCWGEAYTLDAWANLNSIAATTNSNYTGCTEESGFTTTADGNNHLPVWAYDASGNATSDGVVTNYVWNAESELKSAAGVTYAYDGDGRRVSKVGSKLYWYGSGGDTLAETDSSGNTTAEYIFFGGKRIAMLPAGGNPIYYVEDLLGTSRVITTNAGVVCYDADFYPYGGERAYTNTCPQNYKFEGKERDTETGNDDFGARYYSNRFGRWLSADWSSVPVPVPYALLTNPQSLNLYAMVHDDPETFADLDGHEIPVWEGDDGGPRNGKEPDPAAAKFIIGVELAAAGGVAAEGAGLLSQAAAYGRGLIGLAASYLLTPSGQQNVVNITQAVGDYVTGSVSPASAVEVGVAREAAVANAVGGKVSRMLVKGASTSTDVDVIGKAGEYIGVGGPAKAADLAKFGQKLSALKEAAGKAGTTAKYWLEKGTSQDAIKLAQKILGQANVTVYNIVKKKHWWSR